MLGFCRRPCAFGSECSRTASTWKNDLISLSGHETIVSLPHRLRARTLRANASSTHTLERFPPFLDKLN